MPSPDADQGDSAEPELEPYDSPRHPLAPWFADARRRRGRGRQRAAGLHPSGLRRRPLTRAIITIVHNEPVFLPIWLAYYSRFFAPGDIYVLDNDTTDGSIETGGFHRLPAPHDSVDHAWMVQTIEDLQHELLHRYDVVLVTDVDEIIAPVPTLGNLGDYLDRFDEEWVNCLGYELLHRRDREPPLRLDRPILQQRHCWFFNGAYDKAAVTRAPMSWRPGLHGRTDFQFNFDPDLRLIHLHRMDYDLCLARHRTRGRKPWAPQDAAQGWAIHNRIVDEAQFGRWFYEDTGFAGFSMRPEEIQPLWRDVL